MLKFNSIGNEKEYIFSIDEYIPFSIDFVKNCCELVYFRFGNGNTSLLEISIDRDSLEICNITLVSIDANDVFLCNKEKIENNMIVDIGFPIFEYNNSLNIYEHAHFDCFYNHIKLLIDKDNLCIYINDKKTVKNIKNKNIIFGFDIFENLNSIILNNIPFNNIELIKKSILY